LLIYRRATFPAQVLVAALAGFVQPLAAGGRWAERLDAGAPRSDPHELVYRYAR